MLRAHPLADLAANSLLEVMGVVLALTQGGLEDLANLLEHGLELVIGQAKATSVDLRAGHDLGVDHVHRGEDGDEALLSQYPAVLEQGLGDVTDAGAIDIDESDRVVAHRAGDTVDEIDHDDLADSLAGHLSITIRPEPPKLRQRKYEDAATERAAKHRAAIAKKHRLKKRGIDLDLLRGIPE
jgi:hypothetical protein